MDEIKTYAHVYPLQLMVKDALNQYAKDHHSKISKVSYGITGYGLVILKNGEEHCFMSDYTYSNWCRGRKYILNGKRYIGGFQLFN